LTIKKLVPIFIRPPGMPAAVFQSYTELNCFHLIC